MKSILGIVFASLLMTPTMAPNAGAQPRQGEPASVLVFPLVDSRPTANRVTLLTVTNTNTDGEQPAGSPSRRGDVAVRFSYVQQGGGAVSRLETLTPGDTLTVLAAQHAPTMDHGHLIVVAEDPVTRRPIAFNHLTGHSLVVDLARNAAWGLTVWGFQGHPAGMPAAAVTSLGGHAYTDMAGNGGNENGAVDFDGKEYSSYPDFLYVPNFVETKDDMIGGEMVLMCPMKPTFKVGVLVTVTNDRGESVGLSREFYGWTHFSFGELPATATIGGSAPLHMGWMTVDGVYALELASGTYWKGEGGSRVDPPLLGAYAQRLSAAGGFGFGGRFATFGGQNGNEFPADGRN